MVFLLRRKLPQPYNQPTDSGLNTASCLIEYDWLTVDRQSVEVEFTKK